MSYHDDMALNRLEESTKGGCKSCGLLRAGLLAMLGDSLMTLYDPKTRFRLYLPVQRPLQLQLVSPKDRDSSNYLPHSDALEFYRITSMSQITLLDGADYHRSQPCKIPRN